MPTFKLNLDEFFVNSPVPIDFRMYLALMEQGMKFEKKASLTDFKVPDTQGVVTMWEDPSKPGFRFYKQTF